MFWLMLKKFVGSYFFFHLRQARVVGADRRLDRACAVAAMWQWCDTLIRRDMQCNGRATFDPKFAAGFEHCRRALHAASSQDA